MLCVPDTCPEGFKDRYLLTRSIIIRHLSLNLTARYPSVKVLEFKSLLSEDFEQYLDTAGLHFVMLHDGASQSAALEGPKTFEKETLRAIIAWFNEHNLNVALINRIDIRDTKVGIASLIHDFLAYNILHRFLQ